MTTNGASNPPPRDDGISLVCGRVGHQLSGNVCVRCGSVVKPCAKRLRLPSGAIAWCILPEHSTGDCHGVSERELPAAFVDVDAKGKVKR